MQITNSPKAGAALYAKDIARVSAFYEEVAGLPITHAEDGFMVLELPHFQLVVVAIPDDVAATIEIVSPPVRRTETPIKLVFPVASIAAARSIHPSGSGCFKAIGRVMGMTPRATSSSFARRRMASRGAPRRPSRARAGDRLDDSSR